MQTTLALSPPSDPVALLPDSNIMRFFDPSPVRVSKSPATVDPMVSFIPCHSSSEPHPEPLHPCVSGFCRAVHSLLPPPRDPSAEEFYKGKELIASTIDKAYWRIIAVHTVTGMCLDAR